MSEFKLGLMTLKSLFSKPATKLYPIEQPGYFPATKGHIVVDPDRCRYDGLCAMQCPTGAIEVDRAQNTWSIDRFKCIQCRNCVEVCPEKCLSMANTYAEPGSEHYMEVFGPSPENLAKREREKAEKAAWAAKVRAEAAAKRAAEAAAKAEQAAPAPAQPEAPAPAAGAQEPPQAAR